MADSGGKVDSECSPMEPPDAPLDAPLGPDADVIVQIITPASSAASPKDPPSTGNNVGTPASKAASPPYLGKYKYVHVRCMDGVRRNKRFTVKTKSIIGFTDDANCREPYLLEENTVVNGEVITGFVQILAKMESLADYNNNKRLPVHKINESTMQEARNACKMIDPRSIKQEKVEAQKRKKISKAKLPKQTQSEISSKKAAKKVINMQLLSVVTSAMGKDDITEDEKGENDNCVEEPANDGDRNEGGRDVIESGVEDDVNRGSDGQETCKRTENQVKDIQPLNDGPPPNQAMQKRLEELERSNKMLVAQLAAFMAGATTSTPRTPVSSVRGTPRSQLKSATRRVQARRSLEFEGSGTSSASSPSCSLAAPLEKEANTAASMPKKAAPIKRRKSVQPRSVPKRRRSARDPNKLFIPKDCHPTKYAKDGDRPFQHVYIKKLPDGKEVPMVHLYYGEELTKEDWLNVRCASRSLMEFIIGLCRFMYGLNFRDKAVDIKKAKPRLKNQVRKPFTPKKKACIWRCFQWFIRLRFLDVKADYQNYFNDHLRRAINNEIIIALRAEKRAEGLDVDMISLDLMEELDMTIDEEVARAANQDVHDDYDLPDEIDLLQNEGRQPEKQSSDETETVEDSEIVET